MIQEVNVFDNLQRPIGNEPGEISATEWVDLVMTRALELNASDIHFDVAFGKFLARVRVDGVLQKIAEGTSDKFETVIARLKVISNLNSAEHRQPQEGHALIQVGSNGTQTDIDTRISIFPTVYGESAAIRVLNRKDFLFDSFESMGMTPQDAEMFRNMIVRPHGMILVTGPTGSGKSATIYTALNMIKSVEKNIVTLEDPVEYQMELVRQSQINNDIEYTFARGMRSILRQDPDVIMIGEIRDDETAEIAIRAALTGRLLFSTMHTNDSIGAVTRFVEFGIPRSFIATSILLVMAKRLIRKNCPVCIQSYVPAQRILEDAGITDPNAQFSKGVGCDACSGTGYQGRTAIYEFFVVDPDIQRLIIENAPYSKLYETARTKGMKNLKEAAIELALSGQTNLEEALHVSA